MTRIAWDSVGSRLYEGGVDRGVLYVDGVGVPWNGLTSISDNPPGGTSKSYYIDGEKYLNALSREEYQATLTAYTYPDEFEPCNGIEAVRPGFHITKQKRKTFGLSYRTLIGNDQTSTLGYKIHLVYNVLASPSSRTYKTISGSSEVDDFSWNLTSLPVVYDGYRRTSHWIIDSRDIDPSVLSALEDILYGSNSTSSRLPNVSEVVDLIDTNNILVVVDNGDGTYTMTAPISKLYMLDTAVFQLTWSTAVFVDTDTYTVSSS